MYGIYGIIIDMEFFKRNVFKSVYNRETNGLANKRVIHCDISWGYMLEIDSDRLFELPVVAFAYVL